VILFVVTYLLQDDLTRWTDYVTSTICCCDANNLEVLVIVLIMKKRFLRAEKVFCSLLLLSQHWLA